MAACYLGGLRYRRCSANLRLMQVDWTGVSCEIQLVIPIRRRAEHCTNSGGSSCTIWVSPRELYWPHIVSIQEIDGALLSASDQQVRNSTRLIGQNHHPAGPQVQVILRQMRLIRRSEVIGQRKAAPSLHQL